MINFSGLADINKTDNKPLETIHQNLLPMVNTYLLSVKYNLKSYIFASTVYVNSFYEIFISQVRFVAKNI